MSKPHKPRSNTKAIRLFQQHMAAKGLTVAKPVDVYRGVWSEKTANDTKKQEEQK
jgi:hypothetical protein